MEVGFGEMEIEEGRLNWPSRLGISKEITQFWRNGGREGWLNWTSRLGSSKEITQIRRNGGWIWRNGSPGRPIEMVSPNWDESVELGGIELPSRLGISKEITQTSKG
ncbi:hypothetical protein SLEP1_g57720 [Rubroshorea leprosula]|uniref:Uncharacterized protein n=1 Tax=Rubroshorea leprosula TaxID=152421 RepID=A0AAV5MPH8_9ROSI|nr:hypothetical protein SLEP1_g57720 [Rubroshorea leprosula]